MGFWDILDGIAGGFAEAGMTRKQLAAKRRAQYQAGVRERKQVRKETARERAAQLREEKQWKGRLKKEEKEGKLEAEKETKKVEETRRLKLLKQSLEVPQETNALLRTIQNFQPTSKYEKENTESLASYLRKEGYGQIEIEAPLPIGNKRADLLIEEEYLIEAKINFLDLGHLASIKEKLDPYRTLKGCKVIIVIYGNAREDLVERLRIESQLDHIIILGNIKPIRSSERLKDIKGLKLKEARAKAKEDKIRRDKELREALQKAAKLQQEGLSPLFTSKEQEDKSCKEVTLRCPSCNILLKIVMPDWAPGKKLLIKCKGCGNEFPYTTL